ncbi:MAG: pseudouridine synthase [Ignavibacteriales bacterium]
MGIYKVIARLNRYLSMCGIASRRKADQIVSEGRVRVNGLVVKELGYRVDTEKDIIEVGGEVIRPERKRYVVLNKPPLYLTTLKQEGKKTIQELIKGIPERVYPVGRLDYDTEGLLILTNDGELANTIIHPRYKLPKVYVALVKGKIERKTLEKMIRGTRLEDGFTRPDRVKIIKYEAQNTLVEITFHEGRNRLVKRFLLKFEHPVLRLKRIAVGPVRLGALPRGRWRDMTDEELRALAPTF